MVKVSIILTTYNHEDYIEKCIENIINQDTIFNYEIIWFDDASTDNTVSLGNKALSNTNIKVVKLHNTNNRHQVKISNLLDKIENCSGDYILMIDGDDYWTTNKKIQIQVSALENFPNLNICFTPALIESSDPEENKKTLSFHSDSVQIFNPETVIESDGGFMPTASLCIRKKVFITAPKWLYSYLPVGDYPMQVIASLPNGALYLPVFTCVYRSNTPNSWTQKIFKNTKNRMIFEYEFIECLIKINTSFPEYSNSLKKILYNHHHALSQLSFLTNNYNLLTKATNLLLDFNQN